METPVLTPEQRRRMKLLVKTLRSSKYRQTTYKLARYDRKARRRKFCCLGVACEVAIADGLKLSVERDSGGNVYSYNGDLEILPREVVRWYGFDTNNPNLRAESPNFPDHRKSMTAAELNDEYGWTFRQIADALVKTYNLEENNNE